VHLVAAASCRHGTEVTVEVGATAADRIGGRWNVTPEPRGAVIGPAEGRRVPVGPNWLTVKVGPESGGRRVGLFESQMPPGGGFPFAHLHEAYEEIFYVLEGVVEYRVGDEWIAATAGSTVFVPPGVVHAFRNSSPRAARHLVVHAPVEALAMVEEIGRTAPEGFAAVLDRYGSRLVEGTGGANPPFPPPGADH
jgi:quercetin dioxygenase-like cupin family protein